ncbi:MAG: ZIP family metal transporter [Elusimicrobiota bacterium]|nr:ZIP family metal transporter [Elusimicrobiota bacterium]
MEFSTIFYSLIAGTATLIGTLLIFYYEDYAKKNSVYFISFAAGIMLATSFFHLMPEASEISANVPAWVLCGFLIFYIIQNFLVTIHPCAEENCEVHRLGIMSFIGLSVHSLLDGIAIAVGFEVSSSIGLFTAIAVILHEFPEGLITTGILIHTGEPRKKIWTYSIIVALATPFGAIASLLFLKNLPPNILGILLSITAGSFIYLSAADLIPEIHKSNRKINSVILLFGIFLILILGKIFH